MEQQVASDFYARRMILDRDMYDAVRDNNTRREMEASMLNRICGHTDITFDDFAVLTRDELFTLWEVFQDLEHYKLAMSMIEQAPSQWDKSSLKVWIPFVSRKYVDNYDVDINREDEKMKQILRGYWEDQMEKWNTAADCYERIRRHIRARNKLEDMKDTVRLIGLSCENPVDWDEKDHWTFQRWMLEGRELIDEATAQAVRDELQEWQETNEILLSSSYIVRRPLPPPKPVPAFTPAVQSHPAQHDFADPEDWDKGILNQWLEQQATRMGIALNPLGIPEGVRRLIMIYVRCAWPQDKERLALNGLRNLLKHEQFAVALWQNILDNRPGGLKQQDSNKTESQRHRNRRDLHLWEFLLILLANPATEGESIRWKVQDEGKFELTNRARVARMWGLTKGNTRMNYDNMSRSVRQYYKDDNTGIMIRHKAGEPSFGKYSYQFSMDNSEVHKLWKSLSNS